MPSVYFDADCDQVVIVDGQPRYFAPRTLVADHGDGNVGARLKGQAENQLWAPFDQITDREGNRFPDPASTYAYLVHIFDWKPVPEAIVTDSVSGSDTPAGLPVAVSRLDGTLSPARADSYPLAFVAGLASDAMAAGFVGRLTRQPLTLPDWTAVAGMPSLETGQPYFLKPEGGLAPVPDLTTRCLVRVGNATGPHTLAPILSDPILL